jgi:hypothetical protein
MPRNRMLLTGAMMLSFSVLSIAAPDPNFHIYLCIGQSNMVGAPKAQAQDSVTNARVKVLGYSTCGARTYNTWSTAQAPLHDCGNGVGPGDYFGKTMADSFPGITIGLVPCGINAADINLFRKNATSVNRSTFTIPPDNHWTGAYSWIISRAQLAQQSGVIKGIIFHQGEANTGDAAWPGYVQEFVNDLRTDLGLVSDSVPFIAGHLLPGGCCAQWHDPLIDKLLGAIPNCGVVSASGLMALSDGLNAHFDLASQREFGRRYALAMLQLIKAPVLPPSKDTLAVYTDNAVPVAGVGYVTNGTATEITTGANEGSKCIDFNYTTAAWYSGVGIIFGNWGSTLDATGYTKIKIATKGMTAGLNGTITFNYTDAANNSMGNLTGAIVSPANSWANSIIEIPSTVPRTGIQVIKINIAAATGTSGHVYIDGIYLLSASGANATIVSDHRLTRPNPSPSFRFSTVSPGRVSISVFSLDGVRAGQRTMVAVASGETFLDAGKILNEIPGIGKGIYVVKVFGPGANLIEHVIRK